MLLPRKPKKDGGRGLVLAAAALQDHISRSYNLSHPLPPKAPVATCSRCGRLPSNEKRRTLPTLNNGSSAGKCEYNTCALCSICCSVDCKSCSISDYCVVWAVCVSVCLLAPCGILPLHMCLSVCLCTGTCSKEAEE